MVTGVLGQSLRLCTDFVDQFPDLGVQHGWAIRCLRFGRALHWIVVGVSLDVFRFHHL